MVLVELPDGRWRKIPKAWTSLAVPGSYETLSRPPVVAVESLLLLVSWADAVAMRVGGAGPSSCNSTEKVGS